MKKPDKKYDVGCEGFTLIEALIVAAIIGMLASLAIPAFMQPRAQAQRDICRQHLRTLDAAKDMWALEAGQSSDATPSAADLAPFFARGTGKLVCPRDPNESFNTSYEIGSVDDKTRCKIFPQSHSL